ncbi:FtsX-like permease family protein [Ilyomonas limi]|uniref:FtsX-like permease family protein n=1 Tax=Ilyomonas limi TaxID=2575867 RepID=A0A4U3L0J2_9BACT|nr:ABC transporter permease [Ilyomonas limi]TKK68252.1 FtsX-like permease family protein [Ilyomonas limi]
MLQNFFKTAIRSLLKNKGYSFLNIFGLAIGIACAGLIFLWVESEVSYDNFNTKKDRLYFIRENQKYDTYTATFGSTPGVLAPAMQAEIPGIANTCRVYDEDATLFTVNDKAMYAAGLYAEPSLFSMFTFPFVEGNAKTAFAQRYSLVITEKAAIKFFGKDRNVVGKTIRVDNKQDYIITGVLKDIPANSSLQFEWVAPFEIVFDASPWLHNWGNNSLSTYIELKPGVASASVNKLLYNFIQQREPKSIARPFLWSMSQWHLYDDFENGKPTGGGQITYVRLFSVIAWIILLIACINFMNLATARSEIRAREVGVRKVLGSGKNMLVAQFIGEALLMALLAAIVAVAIMTLVLPSFNTLVQKELSLDVANPIHLTALLLITFICGLLAGSYPSLYLSSFNPVFVLKGIKTKGGSAAFIRKGLVVLQFSISIVLIIATVIIYQQIQHVKNRNLGFNKNNLVQAELQGDVAKYFTVMKQDLLNTGVVENVAASDHTTLYGGNNTGSLTWQGKAPDAQILVSGRNVTPEFMSTSGIKLLEGRDFVPTDSIQSKNLNVIITRSLEKLMGKESAIGKTLWNSGDTSGQLLTVVGVVNDYVYGNMYGKPDPVVFSCTAPEHTNKMYLRLKQGANVEKALATIEAVMKKDNPAYPFTYTFVDDQFNKMFLSEMLISKLSRVFAALAIIISCLGLFGLAAYTAERRTKEIGIRKVLGASVSGITTLLSKDFMLLVVISCLIAFPVAWWTMHNWLQNYQYRIEISWWIFVIAGIAAMLISLLTISFQSIKAALANPVNSLRNE